MEIGQLEPDDAAIFLDDLGIAETSRDRIIRVSFELLGLIPFLTVGRDECRAWTIRRGTTAVDAAGTIHSDIQRGFIRAEIVSYDDLIDAGSMAETKKRGTFRREGKTYIVARRRHHQFPVQRLGRANANERGRHGRIHGHRPAATGGRHQPTYRVARSGRAFVARGDGDRRGRDQTSSRSAASICSPNCFRHRRQTRSHPKNW